MNIKRTIRKLNRNIQLVKWSFKTAIPHTRGRWYVFRDAPDWFVRLVSRIRGMYPNDPDIEDYAEQAYKEWQTRVLRKTK